jgi:predicted acetyltransferase
VKIKMIKIKVEEKEILKNLMEKYNYEFSQYEKTDVNKLGLYGYDWLDCYWTEKNRYPYFILVDNILAGFVLINDYPEINMKMDYAIAEFFIMYKYRRLGVGKYIVYNVLNKYKGTWQIKYHPKNIVSVKFWNSIIKEYTNGQYKIIKNNKETLYRDGTIGEVIIFDNKNIK